MNILVATKETQGQRKNDFFWAEEGELVMLPAFTCDGGFTDDRCGCNRSMCGIQSGKATTTVKVVATDYTLGELTHKVLDSRRAAGWKPSPGVALSEAKELVSLAESFRNGDILELRNQELRVRARIAA